MILENTECSPVVMHLRTVIINSRFWRNHDSRNPIKEKNGLVKKQLKFIEEKVTPGAKNHADALAFAVAFR
jgi:hypothetical protein